MAGKSEQKGIPMIIERDKSSWVGITVVLAFTLVFASRVNSEEQRCSLKTKWMHSEKLSLAVIDSIFVSRLIHGADVLARHISL